MVGNISKHLPVRDASNHVANTLASHIPTNTQLIQTVRKVKDLGRFLNSGLSTVDRGTKNLMECFYSLTS